MTTERGILIVKQKSKTKRSIMLQCEGKPAFNVSQGALSKTLSAAPEHHDGKEVEFEFVKGQPARIREVGGTFVDPGSATQAAPQTRPPQRGAARGQQAQPAKNPAPNRVRPPGQFHNPYNFIPAPPRNTQHEELGDHKTIAQDTFASDRYTGTLRVKLTVHTPLLLPELEHTHPRTRHTTYSVRQDEQGNPLLPASSVRGMLRSAYETITNSRLGRFDQKARLAYRGDTGEGARLVPARVERDADGNLSACLMNGTSEITANGPGERWQYAAWLPRYRRGEIHREFTLYYADNTLPAHGDAVVCWVERFVHGRSGFPLWRVKQIARGHDLDALGPRPQPTPQPRDGTKTRPHQPSEMKRIKGWVCISNANIGNKHDERVFFAENEAEYRSLDPSHEEMWRELIFDYQALHEEEIEDRRTDGHAPDAYLGREPGQTAWSRHVYTEGAEELTEGTLCYVRLRVDLQRVEALFPVMLSRALYDLPPEDLLDASLRPAATSEELSPADRVFGWVKASGKNNKKSNDVNAIRGLLKVGPVTCTSPDAIEHFTGAGLPLAILSAPKPSQGRFYVARNRRGEAQRDGLSKREAGYSEHKGLRGRKVYPHHKNLPEGHWKNPTEDRTQHSGVRHHQEYRRPKKDRQEQRDSQNRSIMGWVKVGATFSFDLHVHNLSAVELGALCYLITLDEAHHLRLGGGKPLGFGSVRLELLPEESEVCLGSELAAARYSSWLDEEKKRPDFNRLTEEYKRALLDAYPDDATRFEQVSFIRSFLIACTGPADDLPTHYPRKERAPDPKGESYKWFTDNERGQKLALGELHGDPGFPYQP